MVTRRGEVLAQKTEGHARHVSKQINYKIVAKQK